MNEWVVLTTGDTPMYRVNKVLLTDADPKFWQLWVQYPKYLLHYDGRPFTDFHASLRALDSRVFVAHDWEDRFAHCRRFLECIECEIAARVIDREIEALREQMNAKKRHRAQIEQRLHKLRFL